MFVVTLTTDGRTRAATAAKGSRPGSRGGSGDAAGLVLRSAVSVQAPSRRVSETVSSRDRLKDVTGFTGGVRSRSDRGSKSPRRYVMRPPISRSSEQGTGRPLLPGVDERDGCRPADEVVAVLGLDIQSGARCRELDRHPDVPDVPLEAR